MSFPLSTLATVKIILADLKELGSEQTRAGGQVASITSQAKLQTKREYL